MHRDSTLTPSRRLRVGARDDRSGGAQPLAHPDRNRADPKPGGRSVAPTARTLLIRDLVGEMREAKRARLKPSSFAVLEYSFDM